MVSEDVSAILVALKCDMVDDLEVDVLAGAALARENGVPFVECSAKNYENVELVFECAYNKLFDQWNVPNAEWPLCRTPVYQTLIVRTIEDEFRNQFRHASIEFQPFFYDVFLPFIVDMDKFCF